MKWWIIFWVVFFVVALYTWGIVTMSIGENYDEWMNRAAILEVGIFLGYIFGSWGKDKFRSTVKEEWPTFLIVIVFYFFLLKFVTLIAVIILPPLIIEKYIADKI